MDEFGQKLSNLIEQTRKIHSLPDVSKDEIYTIDMMLSASIVIAYLLTKEKLG